MPQIRIVLYVFGLLMVSSYCRAEDLNALGCPLVNPRGFEATIDLSNRPETANGKLRICMRDDPNDSQMPYYMQGSVLFPYSMMNADALRSYSTDMARLLVSTLLGRNEKVLEADIVMFNDVALDDENSETVVTCLQALKDGMCDVAMCNTFANQDRTIKYNVDWIETRKTHLEHVVVYPKSAACNVASLLDLCGRRVFVQHGSALHEELLQLNVVGGACSAMPVDIRSSTYYWDDFKSQCHGNTNTSNPCFLIGGAKRYWQTVCNSVSSSLSSEDDDGYGTNCDLTRFVGIMYGSAWAVRSHDKHLHDALSKGMQTLIHAGYVATNQHEYAFLESKWNSIRNVPCLSLQQDLQSCATLSECTIPSGQARCTMGCIHPDRCVIP